MLKLGEKEALKGKMSSKSPARVSSFRGLQEGRVGLLQASSTAHTYEYPQAHTRVTASTLLAV